MTQEPVAPNSKQKIVVVLGMHRNGTSLLTNLLTILGVDVGGELLAADGANELGYWENERILRTQDALLNHLAKDWGGVGNIIPFAIDWDRWPEFRPFQEQLVSIVRDEISKTKGIWGFKDPRTCRLLPMWKQIFAELNLEPLYVLAFRNPAVVVDSLLKASLDPLHSELAWLLSYLDVIRDVGNELRVVVDYDRWFTAPKHQAQAVAKALDLAWPVDDTGLLSRLTQTIRPDLRHSKARRPCCLPFVTKTYEALQRAAATGRAPDELVLNDLRRCGECLTAVLELSSGTGKIAEAVGKVELSAGNLEAALEAFKRAARLQPRLASAYSGQACVLQSLGRRVEALNCGNRALSLDPADAVALKVLAEINLEREKEKRAAEAIFNRGAKLVAAPPIVPAPVRVRRNGPISPVAAPCLECAQ